MKVFLDEIPKGAEGEHDIDERRDQRQQNLEDHNIRQSHKTQHTFAGEHPTVFVHRLQNSKGPPKPLSHQAICISGRLSVGQGHVFIFHPIAPPQ
jgi:hypothetical protein